MKRFAKLGIIVAAASAAASAQPTADDPLLRPIAPDYAARWLQPQPPVQVFGNSYLVGFGGLNVGLIRTSAGLILIDAALPQAVPAIEDNIRRLGFKPSDVKLILSTEPHYDHAGGLAALARDTGAIVVASAPATQILRRGRTDAADPQAPDLLPFPAVQRLRVVRDGERIKLGDTVVTARATPGHTAGSMSWTWRSCEGSHCASIVFGASLNPVSAEGYRFSDPANTSVAKSFRRTFAALREMPCDILLTAHPNHAGGDKKLAALRAGASPNPFIDRAACRAYADAYEILLDKRLAGEAASR